MEKLAKADKEKMNNYNSYLAEKAENDALLVKITTLKKNFEKK